jgi:hypothetical protein
MLAKILKERFKFPYEFRRGILVMARAILD